MAWHGGWPGGYTAGTFHGPRIIVRKCHAIPYSSHRYGINLGDYDVPLASPWKPQALFQSDLKSSLSSIARKQNLLAAVPPALRGLPLLAFAAADLYGRKYGRNPLEQLLFPGANPGGHSQIEVRSPSPALGIGPSAPRIIGDSTSTISGSCGVCSRRGLRGLATARHFDNFLLWHRYWAGFEVLRFYDGWRLKQMASPPGRAEDGVH